MSFFYTKDLQIKDTMNLLLKPIWSVADIMKYTGFKKTKAYEIMNIAKTKFNGKVYVSSSVVSMDSVLLALNTSYEREAYKYQLLKAQERRLNEKTL